MIKVLLCIAVVYSLIIFALKVFQAYCNWQVEKMMKKNGWTAEDIEQIKQKHKL